MRRRTGRSHRISQKAATAPEWAVVVVLRDGARLYYMPDDRLGASAERWTELASRAGLWDEDEARALSAGMDVQGRVVSYEVVRIRRRPPGR